MPIAWKWRAKDAKGEYIEAAPGQPFFYCRGHETAADMIRGANILLNNKRLDCIRFGMPDPGYVLDVNTLQQVNEPEPLDLTKPLPLPGERVEFPASPGLVPLNLPTDPEMSALHQKHIDENGG